MPTCLLVDDEPLKCKGMERIIGRVAPEWKVIGEVYNGREAIEVVQRDEPDLIFTDIRMPEMDGIELAEALIGNGYSLPIVFVTGYDEFAYVQHALRANAFDYLLKPLQEDDVRNVFTRFYKEKYHAETRLEPTIRTKISQYEFELANTFESPSQTILSCVKEWYSALSKTEAINLNVFVELTVRLANAHLLKRGMLGFEYKPKIHQDNTDRILSQLSDKIAYFVLEAGKQSVTETEKIVALAQDYIMKNMHRELTLAMVAHHVHMNPTYFSEFFRNKTGETFIQYITRLRIETAKQWLTDPFLKIKDLSQRLGYDSYRHFSKIFKLTVGLTPKEYRQKCLPPDS
ncbi:response regulator transcription factor [Cohnella hongkongensis]|uniref:Response regulator n=1 Tax=Cohnella hongkongensis TaxID=178337 RepID=A0ABV9FK31_9BACL